MINNIKDLTLGQYAQRDSFIHKLDPRTKILSTILLMSLLLFVQHLEILILFLILLLILFRLAKLNVSLAIRNLHFFFWLFLITFTLHCFVTEGNIILSIPYLGLQISQEGFNGGIFYTLRIALLILFANLFTLTTSPMSILDGFEHFLSPFKRFGLPAHEIAMMMSISLRFIPILLEESIRIRRAQISRGAQFHGNIFQRIKSLIPLLIPLFHSTFRRANDLALAMDSRCYRGGVGRTSYYILKYHVSDLIVIIVVLGIGCCLVFYG